MKILILNFDALNPLAHEWAHILNDGNLHITLINHRSSLKCIESELEILDITQRKVAKNQSFDVIFLPWLPPRNLLITTFLIWLSSGRPNIFWIDHNPIQGRDRQGLIIGILRKKKFSKVHRLVHASKPKNESKSLSLTIPHPIFSHAFENLKPEYTNLKKERLTLSFIGRLDDQKGVNSLPRIARLISNAVGKPIHWNIAGNNPNIDYVENIVKEIEGIPNVSVESHIYGKNCPDELIHKSLATSHFLLAPYKRITASGTFALALACSTEILCLGESEPLGLEPFLGTNIYCINESEIDDFFQSYKHDTTQKKNQKFKIDSHNINCHDEFINIVNKIRNNY